MYLKLIVSNLIVCLKRTRYCKSISLACVIDFYDWSIFRYCDDMLHISCLSYQGSFIDYVWSMKQYVLQITNQGYFSVLSSLINFFSSLKLEQTVVSSIGNQWNVNHGLIDILFSITVPPCLSIDWLPNTIFVIIKGEILLNWQQSHNFLFMYA